MITQKPKIIDGDGHVVEDHAAIAAASERPEALIHPTTIFTPPMLTFSRPAPLPKLAVKAG